MEEHKLALSPQPGFAVCLRITPDIKAALLAARASGQELSLQLLGPGGDGTSSQVRVQHELHHLWLLHCSSPAILGTALSSRPGGAHALRNRRHRGRRRCWPSASSSACSTPRLSTTTTCCSCRAEGRRRAWWPASGTSCTARCAPGRALTKLRDQQRRCTHAQLQRTRTARVLPRSLRWLQKTLNDKLSGKVRAAGEEAARRKQDAAAVQIDASQARKAVSVVVVVVAVVPAASLEWVAPTSLLMRVSRPLLAPRSTNGRPSPRRCSGRARRRPPRCPPAPRPSCPRPPLSSNIRSSSHRPPPSSSSSRSGSQAAGQPSRPPRRRPPSRKRCCSRPSPPP